MAAQLTCDVCREEPAGQILTNVETGDTMTLGQACLMVFYHQSLLTLLEAGEHTKIPSKCQTCRRVHEHMTLAYNPPADTETTETPADTPVPVEVES